MEAGLTTFRLSGSRALRSPPPTDVGDGEEVGGELGDGLCATSDCWML